MGRTFLFDCQGTLVNNPFVKEEDMEKVLPLLKAAGHRVIVWSAMVTLIPNNFAALADECWSKELEDMSRIDESFIVFDDDVEFLQSLARRGAKIVAAHQMGDWLVNEVWKVDASDPVTNFNLPATREQQAERVRVTLRKLNKPQSRAILKRQLKHQGEISRLARLYPMHKIYQVRELALHEVTYAGSVGFIMSYLENGNMTFSVFYDRPGHRYTPVSARAEIEPEWIKELSIEEFEEIVAKDNPAVLLA
jgi:hypothetical protein